MRVRCIAPKKRSQRRRAPRVVGRTCVVPRSRLARSSFSSAPRGFGSAAAHAGWLAPRGVFEVGRGVEVMFPRGGGRQRC